MPFQKVKEFFRYYYLAVILLAVMLLGSVLVFVGTRHKARELQKQVFRFRAEQAATAIERRMVNYIQVLLGARGLIEASDEVTRSDWKEFISSQNIERNFPGIQGTGYVTLLKGSEIGAHERITRKEGLPDYRVKPAGNRTQHAVITVLEPMTERNLRAIGFDMWTSSDRRRAMERARDTNLPALSGGVTLVQETDKGVQPGFLIFLPIYQGTTYPVTIAERRAQIDGFVYIPFRAHDLFRAILHNDYPDLEIAVYDGESEPANLLLFSNTQPANKPGSYAPISLNRKLTTAGHTWNVYFEPSQAFYNANQNWWPYLLLAGSLIISLLTFFITLSLSASRRANALRQIITDNATSALFMMNDKGYCTFMNPAAEKMTGFTMAEISRKPLHELVHHHYPDGRLYPKHECPIDRALPTNNYMRAHEDVFFRKDGSSFEASVAASPIYEKGVPVSTVIEVRDITELKEAERRIQQSTEQLQQVFYHVPALVALMSADDLVYVLVNPQFLNLFGNRPMLGYRFSEAHPELTEQGFEKHMKEVVRTGKPYVAREQVMAIDRHNNGELVPGFFNFVYEPIPDNQGHIESVLLFGVEVTELVRSRQELSSANEELKRINTDLDNFVYSASHDLKSPITNIEGLTRELHESLAGKLIPEEEKLLELMEKSAAKLRKTVQELSEITKVQKQIHDSEEPLQFEEILADVLSDIAPQVEAADARIDARFEVKDISYARKNLRSILYNLVSNAVRYRSPDRPARISISTHAHNGRTVLLVKDNGLGIKKEQQHKLFGMFQRLHQQGDGSGLGLYIVKRIIENNGGRVEVESEANVGTTFTIWF